MRALAIPWVFSQVRRKWRRRCDPLLSPCRLPASASTNKPQHRSLPPPAASRDPDLGRDRTSAALGRHPSDNEALGPIAHGCLPLAAPPGIGEPEKPLLSSLHEKAPNISGRIPEPSRCYLARGIVIDGNRFPIGDHNLAEQCLSVTASRPSLSPGHAVKYASLLLRHGVSNVWIVRSSERFERNETAVFNCDVEKKGGVGHDSGDRKPAQARTRDRATSRPTSDNCLFTN